MSERLDNYRMRPRPRRRSSVDDGMEHGMPSPWYGMAPPSNPRARTFDQMKRDMYDPRRAYHLAAGGPVMVPYGDEYGTRVGARGLSYAPWERTDRGPMPPEPSWQQYEPDPTQFERPIDSLVRAEPEGFRRGGRRMAYGGRSPEAQPNWPPTSGSDADVAYVERLREIARQNGLLPPQGAPSLPRGLNQLPPAIQAPSQWYGMRYGGRAIPTMDPQGNVPLRRMPRYEDGGRSPETYDDYQAAYDPRTAALMSPELWPELSNAAGRAHRQTFQDRLPRANTIPAAEGSDQSSPPIQGVWPEGSRTEGPNTPIWRAPPMWPERRGPYTPMPQRETAAPQSPAREQGFWEKYGSYLPDIRPGFARGMPDPNVSMKDALLVNPITKAITSMMPEDSPRRPYIKPLVSGVADIPLSLTRAGFLASLPDNLSDINRDISRGDWGGVAGTSTEMLAGALGRQALGRFASPAWNDASQSAFGRLTPIAGARGFGWTKDPMWPRAKADLGDRTYQLKWPGEHNTNNPSAVESTRSWLSTHSPSRMTPTQTVEIVKYDGANAIPVGTVVLRRAPNSSVTVEALNVPKAKINQTMIDDIADGIGNIFPWRHKLVGSNVIQNPKTKSTVRIPDRVYNEPVAPVTRPTPFPLNRLEGSQSAPIREPRGPSPVDRLNEAFPSAPVSPRIAPVPSRPPANTANTANADDAAWRKAISTFGGEAYIPDRVRQLLGRQYGGRVGYQNGGALFPSDEMFERLRVRPQGSQVDFSVAASPDVPMNVMPPRFGAGVNVPMGGGNLRLGVDRGAVPGRRDDVQGRMEYRRSFAGGGDVDAYRTMRPLRRPTTGWAAMPRSNMIDDRRNEWRAGDNFLKIQDRISPGDPMQYPDSNRFRDEYANGGRVMPKAFWE